MELFTLSIVIALGFFFESIFGFGGGLITIPFSILLLGVRDGVTFVLIFQVLLGILMIKNYKMIPWNELWICVLITIPASVGGVFLLSIVDEQILKYAVAAFIFLYLLKECLLSHHLKNQMPLFIRHLLGGVTGGCIQASIGTGGPPFVAYVSSLKMSAACTRVSLMTLLLVSNLVRLPASFHYNLISAELLSKTFIALPLFLIAIFAGQHVHHSISEDLYKKCIKGILLISGICLIY